MTDSIFLSTTNEWSFEHLKNVQMLGIDIGGSLVKIAYSSSYNVKTASLSEDNSELIYSVNECKKLVPTLNFIKFETKYIEGALDYLEKNLTFSKEFNEGKVIKVTGGGAFKYKDLISQKLGVSVEKEDELSCLVNGCNFLIKNVPNEVFSIDYANLEYDFKKTGSCEFPYLLVNVGSGVSILKVESDEKFQRIGGSTIGGATLWGLGSLLTNANGFDEILELAEKGDNKPVDMLVKDIYGGSYDFLDGDLIASSLGKTTRSALDQNACNREEHLKKFKEEDLAKSLLLMICYDLTQIASLHARIHNIERCLFGGSFIRHSNSTMKFLKHGISYWSQNKVECLFLRHEGYLCAVGAFLKTSKEEDHSKYSWYENLARSTTQVSLRPRKESTSKFDCFELNREEYQLVSCPLLDNISDYIPDLIDLTKEEDARNYWLSCFEKTINTYEEQCIKSSSNTEETKKRALDFKNSFLSKLNELKSSPIAYGVLTVRTLLDLREHLMAQFDFFDVYSIEKREENKLGLELLAQRCEYINSIKNQDEKYYELFRGLLAGNIYDYGAQAFIQKQKKGHLDNFNQAINSIDDKLLENNNYSEIVIRMKKNPYKTIYIFVDNSGFDIILGILPIVIEFLKNNTTKVTVILCVNSKAAINDITYHELVLLIKKVSSISKIVDTAYNETKNLLIFETGSASPCLDLSRINIELADYMEKNRELNSELVILEGMGRAIHTNYDSKFKCDCLKIAVIKNEWLATRFGFNSDKNADSIQEKKFPIIFKFETIPR